MVNAQADCYINLNALNSSSFQSHQAESGADSCSDQYDINAINEFQNFSGRYDNLDWIFLWKYNENLTGMNRILLLDRSRTVARLTSAISRTGMSSISKNNFKFNFSKNIFLLLLN